MWSARERIDHHFGQESVAAIFESLRRESDPHGRIWANETLEALEKRSPTMLCVTFEQLRRAKELSLADCFRMELNLIHSCFDHGDLVEGIRAVIIDKDMKPRWKHADIDAVREDEVMAFFAPRWEPSKHPLASLQ